MLLYRGGLAGECTARDRRRCSAQPLGFSSQEKGDLHARKPEGRGAIPRRRSARVLARAVDRNTHTAGQYNAIGLPEFFAIEGVARWNGTPI
ncbi:MAG TPA: hypothetical protein PKD64_07235 [Pirellulaceae bacterium]|nr:hypothetical protein [Pirellulaceae bacterium]HMO91978.1 hypothetical protein [Pirellulaceae bacterium]HMP68777.1 hypothetical protein [Pirellulaceae bacterium]